MLDNLPKDLRFSIISTSHWRRIRTSNVLERLNREIKRRTRIVGVFPNVASYERLISAVLLETSEEWQTRDLYLSFD